MGIVLPGRLTHKLYEAKQKHMAVSPVSPGRVTPCFHLAQWL